MDKLSDVLKQKGVSEERCSFEGQRWLLLLLQLVDVTKPGADEHLMKFFGKGTTKSEALKAHHAQLTKDVCYACMYKYMFRTCTLSKLLLSIGDRENKTILSTTSN